MENRSLYNSMRPTCFAEVVGQKSVTSILSNQISTNKIKHAYIFCGTWGVGKTTVSRIFSNLVNKGQGEPVEIDAASNNGVDFIRSIIQDAQQKPLDCDYKIYIIDECHQLSKAAWDASLKIIEEPPKHVIFIFCTTNVNKVPDTILSRVQRFDFNKVSTADISDRLEYICNENLHVKFDKAALDRIAILSNGHVRDAISQLEKCIDSTGDVTVEHVDSTLGLISYNILFDLVDSILINDYNKAIECLNTALSMSYNKLSAYSNIVDFLLDILLFNKCRNIKCINIPKYYIDRLTSKDYSSLYSMLKSLVYLKRFATSEDADMFIKQAILEEFNNR